VKLNPAMAIIKTLMTMVVTMMILAAVAETKQ